MVIAMVVVMAMVRLITMGGWTFIVLVKVMITMSTTIVTCTFVVTFSNSGVIADEEQQDYYDELDEAELERLEEAAKILDMEEKVI